MIRLEIDGQPVALNQDLSLDFYDYNGIFDVKRNRGAFTYDIDIDLRQGDNARLYRHLYRINNTSKFTDRSACLIVDGHLFAHGKEVVLECNGINAKIQIVCGSSEANAADDTKRLGSLDLGSLPEYTQETALATIHAEPLSVPAVCTPVMVDYVKMPYVSKSTERETVSKMVNLAEYTDLWSDYGSWHSSDKYTPIFRGQPYLVIVIERVLQAMGWRVTSNILRTMEYAKRLIVVHGIESDHICDMLPNWTVSEFLSQIQLMFHVIFVYDNASREVAILDRKTFYATQAATIVIDAENVVTDEATPARKYNTEEEYLYNYDLIKYDLPSDVYGYRGDISDDVNNIVTLHFVDNFSDFNGPTSQFRTDTFYNTAEFFYHVSSGSKWMAVVGQMHGVAPMKYFFARVDQFGHAKKASYKEGESTETLLKIVPAETLVMSINTTVDGNTCNCGVVIPYAKLSGKVAADYTTTESMGLNQWVEGNAPKKRDTSSEKLYVVQYLGRVSILATSHSNNTYILAHYPQVFTHRYIDGRIHAGQYNDNWQGNWRDYILDALWDKADLEDAITFDLRKRLNTTYSNSMQVDDKEVHTINIKVRARVDVTSIFNIAGRRFVCVSLQYQVRNGQLMPYAIGKFLPLL